MHKEAILRMLDSVKSSIQSDEKGDATAGSIAAAYILSNVNK